jgi:hypothetical protein
MGNPAHETSLEYVMHVQTDEFTSNVGQYGSAFESFLDPDVLRARAPAVFAPGAHESTGRTYAFLSTEKLLDALAQAGFRPVEAQQAGVRSKSMVHARHVIRLRRQFETIDLSDYIPELVLLNSHDGTSAYQLRLGMYGVHCRNGLIVSHGAFPVFRVAHRGDILDELIRAALEMAERFPALATQVQQMRRHVPNHEQRRDFASYALTLRYPNGAPTGIDSSKLLVPRRAEDEGSDAWTTFNVVQENVLRGGLRYVTEEGRNRSVRGISSIRTNVRLNTALWEAATQLAA